MDKGPSRFSSRESSISGSRGSPQGKQRPYRRESAAAVYDRMLAQCKGILNLAMYEEPEQSPASFALSLQQCRENIAVLLEYQENCYSRAENGSFYIRARTNMRQATGEMFEWWFSFCDNDSKYRLWHPTDHLHGHWDKDYYNLPMEKRPQRGHHIGRSHHVVEQISGHRQTLRIDFCDPEEYVNCTQFQGHGVTACLCARVNVREGPLGWLAVGHLIHIFVEKDGQNTLYSHFWLGDIHSTGVLSGIVNRIGNTRAFRLARARPWLARGLLRHAAEEMACLSFFLPAFYEEERRLIGGLRLFNKRRSTILQSSIATQQNNEVEGKSPSSPSPPPSPFGDEQRAAALTILERMTSSMDENDPSFKLDNSKKKGGASGDSDTQQQCIIS